MRFALALFTLMFAAAGCGGRVAGEDDVGGTAAGTPSAKPETDALQVLRARCAPEWKNPVGGAGPAPSTGLVTGRWLRCPEDPPGLAPPAYVGTFDAIELAADHTYFRLSVGPDGFERRVSGLGETGKWALIQGGELLFELPSCDQGVISYEGRHTCGGGEAVSPMFETSPTRMRFYGASFFYVRDE